MGTIYMVNPRGSLTARTICVCVCVSILIRIMIGYQDYRGKPESSCTMIAL